jgi:hypothetical protein
MPFVLDNSVVSGWFIGNQATPYGDAIAVRLQDDRAVVPALWELDAAYLELALRLQLPIATLDAPLRDAAMASGVGVVQGAG